MDYGRLNGSALKELTAWFISKCYVMQYRLFMLWKLSKNWTGPGFYGKVSLELELELQIYLGRWGCAREHAWRDRCFSICDFTLIEVGNKMTELRAAPTVRGILRTIRRTRDVISCWDLFFKPKSGVSGNYFGKDVLREYCRKEIN